MEVGGDEATTGVSQRAADTGNRSASTFRPICPSPLPTRAEADTSEGVGAPSPPLIVTASAPASGPAAEGNGGAAFSPALAVGMDADG